MRGFQAAIPRKGRVPSVGGTLSAAGAGCSVDFLPELPMATVLLPLPARDFDPTEVAVSWRSLVVGGHTVVFATPEGEAAVADELMVTGRGLDPWGLVPVVRNITVVGRVLRANADARPGLRRPPRLCRLQGPAALERRPGTAVRRPPPPRRPPGPWHAALPGEHRPPGPGGRVLRPGQAGGRRLPRGAAGGPQHRPLDREIGAPRPAHHRTDLAARAQGLGHRPPHPLLGSELLPHLPRGARTARGLHVGPAGGHPGPGRPRGLPRRPSRRGGLPPEDEWAGP